MYIYLAFTFIPPYSLPSTLYIQELNTLINPTTRESNQKQDPRYRTHHIMNGLSGKLNWMNKRHMGLSDGIKSLLVLKTLSWTPCWHRRLKNISSPMPCLWRWQWQVKNCYRYIDVEMSITRKYNNSRFSVQTLMFIINH